MNVWENLKLTFKRGDMLVKLIYANAAVFFLFKTAVILFRLFNVSADFILPQLAVPADLSRLLCRFWTPLAYMFLHESFFHLFFNMLCLYWFGKIFLSAYSERHLAGLYIAGGLAAALFYAAAYNVFPYYAPMVSRSVLLGASGAVMAVVAAAAVRLPKMEIRLFLFGRIKLEYIAAAAVLISFFGITSSNSGGELAYLGGALTGILFAVLLNKGTDITAWINRLMDAAVNLFRPKRRKIKTGKRKPAPNRKMTDEEYNMNKAKKMAEIDRILDKIKASGYDSLNAEEKRRLFEVRR